MKTTRRNNRISFKRNRFRAGLWIIFFAVIFLVSGCQSLSLTSGNGDEDSQLVFVMDNLVDEECRIQRITDSGYTHLGDRQYKIFCGRWEHASGHIFEIDSPNPFPPLEQLAESGTWKEWLDERLLCEAGAENSILDKIQSRILSCKLRNGEWPYVAFVARVGNSAYLADGIPAILSVLEEGVGVISGKINEPTALTENSRSAALQRVQSVIKGPIYGSGELRRYFKLMASGQLYNNIKDFTTAAGNYRQALALHEKVLGRENSGIADPMMHLALEISNQRRFDEAESLFHRVEKFTSQSLDRSDHARYLSYRALHAANMRKFDEALEYARRATKIREEVAVNIIEKQGVVEQGVSTRERADFAVFSTIDVPTVADIVQSLFIEVSMLERLGQLPEAEKVLRKTKSILMLSPEAPLSWKPEIEGLIARIAKAKGADTERTKHLSTAVRLWERFVPGERPSVINYLKLGEAQKQQGRVNDAMLAFREAINLVKRRNGSLSFDQLSPFFTTALALAEKNPAERDRLHAEMFEAGQLIRSEVTSQNIALAVARLAAKEGAAGNVIRDFQETVDERYALYREYESEIANLKNRERAKKLKGLREKLSAVEQKLTGLGLQVQAAFPRYNQLVDSVVDADRVMELIKPDEALVQVLLGADDGMVFVVKRSKVIATPIDISLSEAKELVEKLRSGLNPEGDGSLPVFDVDLSYLLYRRLFNPVINQIDVPHLITIPSGPFLSLPFALLVTEESPVISGTDYRHVRWLANQSATSLLPSVHSFVGLRDVVKPSKASKSFIGFGDFEPLSVDTPFAMDTSLSAECQARSGKLDAYRKQRLSFGPLPLTKQEILEISRTFPENSVDILLGPKFTDQTVKSAPLSDYHILYFATHGLLPKELECQQLPSLVTSLPEKLENNNDGLLALDEISFLRLDADLVVLAACNTGGSGVETGGESLSGLARAFFFSGARSLVVSHWLAESKSTSALMRGMFTNLSNAQEVGWAGALRKAQLSLINRSGDQPIHGRSHPIFWATFTVVGDGTQGISEPL